MKCENFYEETENFLIQVVHLQHVLNSFSSYYHKHPSLNIQSALANRRPSLTVLINALLTQNAKCDTNFAWCSLKWEIFVNIFFQSAVYDAGTNLCILKDATTNTPGGTSANANQYYLENGCLLAQKSTGGGGGAGGRRSLLSSTNYCTVFDSKCVILRTFGF